MSRKVYLLCLFSLAISIVYLYATGTATAQNQPWACYAGDDYEIIPSPDYDFPYFSQDACSTGKPGYVWRYRVNELDPGKLEKITKWMFFIHSTPGALIEMYGSLPRGSSQSSVDWADGLYTGVVVPVLNVSGGGDYREAVICSKTVNSYGVVDTAIITAKADLPCVAPVPDTQGAPGGIIGVGLESLSAEIPVQQYSEHSFPGDGKVFVQYHPNKGCIQKFYYADEDGNPAGEIPPGTPGWLKADRTTVDFGNLNTPLCREGVIAVKGSPTEYWGYANGSYYCIGAYDPVFPAWYQPCRDVYPVP